MIDLQRDGDVFVLHLDEGENRFNASSVADIHRALDSLDATDGPRSLVTTGEGKFFCNGLDLDWLQSDDAKNHPGFMPDVHRIFGRILTNDAPTAVAINGHAFAGGAMLAAGHDFRVMREERGYFCIPEVDLGLPLTEGMTALLQARIPASPLHEAVVTGRRWNAEDLLASDMVEATAQEENVLPMAKAWAAEQAHHAGECLGLMKRQLYPAAHRTLLPDAS